MSGGSSKKERASLKASKHKSAPDDGLTQSERFIKAAQELGTDDDPERFAERVRKIAKIQTEQGSEPHKLKGE